MPTSLHWREALTNDLLRAGLVPVEHRTTQGVKYLMYLLPEHTEEYPYLHDPVCGDCGCSRTTCLGIPASGWDDLAPEEGCQHYRDSGYACRTAPPPP